MTEGNDGVVGAGASGPERGPGPVPAPWVGGAGPARPDRAGTVPPGTAGVAGAAGAGDHPGDAAPALAIRGLRKHFGQKVAVDGIDLDVPTGSFTGLVGPNGAGKTTTLSMATGLLRPDAGQVLVHGVDMWQRPLQAKRLIGVLADDTRLFDRLTGEQLVVYSGMLSGMPRDTAAERAHDLLRLLDLLEAGGKLVVDYSAGMKKKIGLAAALVHAPSLLVLDEPFESVDPVSAANIRDLLQTFVGTGGTVIVSSHVMDLVQRMCDRVAVVAHGHVLAAGTVDEVRGGSSLEDRFVELVGGRHTQEGPAWLRHS